MTVLFALRYMYLSLWLYLIWKFTVVYNYHYGYKGAIDGNNTG